MIALRCAHPVLSKEEFYTDAEIHWFSPQGSVPDWHNRQQKSLACLIREDEQAASLLMFNAGVTDVDFCLPPLPQGSRWHLAVDSSGSVRQDFVVTGAGTLMDHSKPYHLQERSSAIALAARDSSSTPS